VSGVALKVLGTAIVLIVCTLIAFALLNRFENPTSEFANYSDMAESGVMAAGWIPDIIPRSAYNISETHNLDTNRVRISFSFEPGDTAIAQSKCQEPEEANDEFVFVCPNGELRLTRDGRGSFASN
jgi:hypothetical protein